MGEDISEDGILISMSISVFMESSFMQYALGWFLLGVKAKVLSDSE